MEAKNIPSNPWFENPEATLFIQNSNLTDKFGDILDKTSFRDPFDSVESKMIAIISYIICLLGSLVIFMFVLFETQGLAGPFRSVINQMVSISFTMVS